MAKQDPYPPQWHPSMSDGCSGVLDSLPFSGDCRLACEKHDEAYHYGGNEADKYAADLQFRKNTTKVGGTWIVLGWIRFWGLRMFVTKPFNWLGKPGRKWKSYYAG